MRRWWFGLLVVPAAFVVVACGGAQTDGNNAGSAAADTCPVVDPGPPAVCPEGCTWDGQECRKHSGVIIIDARDGGTTPAPTGSSAPSQP